MKARYILASSIAILAALTAPLPAAALTWDGESGIGWDSSANWVGNAAPVAGDSLVFSGAQNPIAANGLTTNILINGFSFDSTATSFTLFGKTISLGGTITDDSLNAQTINLNAALTATRTINVSSIDGSLAFAGVISGTSFGITKSGAGLLTLSGSNTFTGPVTVSGGTLAYSADSTTSDAPNQLGTTPSVMTTGAIVLDGGALRNTAATQLATTRGIILGNAGGGGGTLDVSGGALTYNGVLANNGGNNHLTKTGTNQLTLGGANTYTGNTVINQGTLKLDFTQLASTTSNIIHPSSTLVLGGLSTAMGDSSGGMITRVTSGATLNMTSKSNASSAQTFSGVTLNGGYSTIQTTQTGTGSNSLTLGTISRTYPTAAPVGYDAGYGSILNFSFAGTLSDGVNAINMTGVSTNGGNVLGNTNGILGGWATYQVGTTTPIASYAALDGNNNVVAYTGYTPQAAGTITSDASKNYQVQFTGTVALSSPDGATTDVHTLSISSATTGATTLTIGTAGTGSTGILRVGANGGFMTGSNGGSLVIGNATNNGMITAGGADNMPGQITFITAASPGGQAILVNSKIVNNGTGVVSVVYGGTQTTNNIAQVTGANTYTGGTTITGGRLRVNNSAAFGTGPVTVLSGAQAWFENAVIMSNDFYIAGSGGPGFDIPSAIRLSSGSTLSGKITLLNDATIDPRNSTGHTLSGQITGPYNLTLASYGSGAVGNYVGQGSITLSNTTNNWGGNLFIDGVKIILGNSHVLSNGSAAGNVVLAGDSTAVSVLELNAKDETINGLVGSQSSAIVRNISNFTASTLTLGDNNATATFAGTIVNGGTAALALTKIGSGTQVLTGANTYTGATMVQGGTLQFTAANTGTGAVSVTGGTLMLSLSGSLNNSAGISINGPAARLVQNSATAITPNVSVTQGAVQGAGTIHFLSVAALASNTVTAGFGGSGTLTVGALTFAGAATVNVANTTSIIATSLTANGPSASIALNSSGAWMTGSTYNLINYSGGSIGGSGGFSAFTKGTVSGLGVRQSATLKNTGSAVALEITGDTPVWTGSAGGTWTTTAGGSPFNWKLQTSLTGTEYLDNDAVLFADTIPGGGAPSTTIISIPDNDVSPASTSFNNSDVDYTLVGPFGINTGTFVKSGTGVVTIDAPNTFTGPTLVNAGILNYLNATAFGSSPITVASGATIHIQGPIAGGSSSLTLSGTGARGQAGALVNLFGNNSYAGPITVASAATIASEADSLTLSGTIGGSSTLTLAGSSSGIITGVVGNTSGGLIKEGSGTWTIAANAFPNSFSGNTIINAGTLKVTNGTASTAGITTTVLGTGTAQVSAGGTLWFDYEVGATTNEVTYPNAISGAGTVKVTAPGSAAAGSAAAVLTGDMSGFTGILDLYPNTGSLGKTRLGQSLSSRLPAASATIKVQSGTSLYLSSGQNLSSKIELYSAGSAENFGALRVESNSTISGAVTLKANSSIGSNSGTGNITGNISEVGGSFTLTKLGSGVVVLSGNNTYSGGTSITGGTISAGNNSAFGTGPVSLTNGTVMVSSPDVFTLANNFNTTGGGGFNPANSFTITGNVTGTAASTAVAGAGTLTFAATSSWTFAASNGLFINAGGTAAFTGTATVDGGSANGAGFVNIGNGSLGGTLSVPMGGSVTILGTTSSSVSTMLVGQSGAHTGTISVSGGSLTIGPNVPIYMGNNNAAAIGNMNVTAGTLTVNKGTLSNNFGATSNADTTVIMMGRDGGSGTINLDGGSLATGRQFIRDGSSATGAGAGVANFNFNGGTLKALADQSDWLRSSAATNFLPLTTVTSKSGGAIIDSNGFNVGINNNIADGGGGLIKLGAGTLTLGGVNAYTGETEVHEGTLLVAGSISGSLTNVVAGTFGGTGTAGIVNVSNGAIVQGGGGILPSGALTVSGNFTLEDGSIVKLTLGALGAHSSLIRLGGTWSFDLNQAFSFNSAMNAASYDNIISGLTGSEAGLSSIGNWTIANPEYAGSTFSYDGSGGIDLALVPEPSAIAVLLSGIASILGFRRRRNRQIA